MKFFLITLLFFGFSFSSEAQLKYIIEDFEGFADGLPDLKENGVFAFGNITAGIDNKLATKRAYSGDRYIQLTREGKKEFGGWGKGIGMNIQLEPTQDYLNFYVYQPGSNGDNTIKIELQEDDNGNGAYEKDQDDSWIYLQKLEVLQAASANKPQWRLISIPISKFKDANEKGDGAFNVNYSQGKLLCFVISFVDPAPEKLNQSWCFDFISFSKGKLSTGSGLFDAPTAAPEDVCSLGAWSKEGNAANFIDIAAGFENNFKSDSDKKLGVIHFFQPFAVDGGSTQNHYPSIERIDKVIQQGYIPMITLEDHFVKTTPNMKQPNLYSIVEGHFDSFFSAWAKEIKQVKGTVLLRILHEFNGDWYPWCIANNDNNPQLLIDAFQRIHNIFNHEQVTNVKFIWCPNSMSLPQEKWNYIMSAYPGNEFVDYVGLDIYNGAGKGTPVWRSFRKEGIENYFILTQQLSDKPLLVCEAASRERKTTEAGPAQSKAEWIEQMSQTLSSDMSKVKLLTWFNEKGSFKIDSSPESKSAFLKHVIQNDYFKSGTKHISTMLKH